MTFEIEVRGRTRTVSIERMAGGKYRVVLDGEPHEVDASRVGVHGLSIIVSASPKGLAYESSSPKGPAYESSSPKRLASESGSPKGLDYDGGEGGLSQEVQVTPRTDARHATAGGGAESEFLITFRGRTVQATVNGQRTGRAASDAAGASDGEQPVVAPMPGRVVRVLVSAGDEVELRQGVVVVEAMKMENELRSPKKGRVKAISVTPGTSVEAGRVLLVVE